MFPVLSELRTEHELCDEEGYDSEGFQSSFRHDAIELEGEQEANDDIYIPEAQIGVLSEVSESADNAVPTAALAVGPVHTDIPDEQIIAKRNVQKLKDYLLQRGQFTGGNQKVLVARLHKAIAGRLPAPGPHVCSVEVGNRDTDEPTDAALIGLTENAYWQIRSDRRASH